MIAFGLPVEIDIRRVPSGGSCCTFSCNPVILTTSANARRLSNLCTSSDHNKRVTRNGRVPLRRMPTLVKAPSSVHGSVRGGGKSQLSFDFGKGICPTRGGPLRLIPFFHLRGAHCTMCFHRTDRRRFGTVRGRVTVTRRGTARLTGRAVSLVFPKRRRPRSSRDVRCRRTRAKASGSHRFHHTGN